VKILAKREWPFALAKVALTSPKVVSCTTARQSSNNGRDDNDGQHRQVSAFGKYMGLPIRIW
jgi:hypothetical protein